MSMASPKPMAPAWCASRKDAGRGAGCHHLSRLKARRGWPPAREMRVINPVSGEPVPMDGKTLGEIVLRGNIVMKGYLKNPSASEEAMAQGWFRSGDLAVWHPDGYVEIRTDPRTSSSPAGEHFQPGGGGRALSPPRCGRSRGDRHAGRDLGRCPAPSSSSRRGASSPRPSSLRSAASRWPTSRPPSIIFTPLPKTSTGKVQNSCCASSWRDDKAPRHQRACGPVLCCAMQRSGASPVAVASQQDVPFEPVPAYHGRHVPPA